MTKSMVTTVLAMAVTASMAFASGGEGEKKNETSLYQGGGWSFKPGSGITYDGGDTFKLNIVNRLQTQWSFFSNEFAPDSNNFQVRRARTKLSGNVFSKDITFLLQLDGVDSGAAGDGNIKDGWIDWNFSTNESGTLGLRMGQGKPGFGLEFTGSSGYLDFVERSTTSRIFANVRSQGIWVHGSHSENKVRWNFGAQNGDVAAGVSNIAEVGEETANADNEVNFVANVSFDPMGDFMGGKSNEGFKQADLEGTQEAKGTIGAGVMIGNNRNAANTIDVESTEINVNTAWKVNGLALQGEAFLRTDDPQVGGGVEEDAAGYYVQGTYTMPKSGDSDLQWGFGLRVDAISTDTTSVFVNPLGAPGDLLEVTAGLNAFYHGHACKTQINYVYQDIDFDVGTDATNHGIMFQVSLIF